ncbi:MAG: ABC transporter substrate-binding protein [Planctomycetota bacterium]|nr:ABC transporter substrate-binding protein [Planctomycetota bacterium]
MWIKRSLVIVPIVLFAFLAQSVFWVPGTASVSNNESRLNRIILYMGGNPEDMNPWTSTKTTDSTISDYFFEGLIRYNRMYELEPWLAETVVVRHEVTVAVPRDMTAEQLEAAIRAEFGTLVAEVSDKGEKKLEIGDELAKAAEAAGAIRELRSFVEAQPSVKLLRIAFSDKPVSGEIVSAVQPDFRARMEKRLGHELYPELKQAALTAWEQLTGEKRVGTPEAWLEQFEDFVGQAGTPLLQHNPVVDCVLHKGVYWTDGPFFSDPARTWLTSVNGDEAGNVVADSKEEAIGLIRQRLATAADAKVDAINYDKRFGDDAKGPWWGRGPELGARDVKLTFEHLKDPVYGSPRRSSYLSILDMRVFDDNRYRVQVVLDELYSPALADLAGSLLPYHVWNLKCWEHEAVRRGLGPQDLGIERAKYNPMSHLRSRDRDFALAPSYLGSMLLEPMNGDSKPYWENNLRVRLRRNEFYWNRKTEYEYVDWFVFDPALGSETSEVVFLGGGMDIYSAKDYQVQRYEAMEDKYYVIKRQPTTYEYIGFNMTREQLKDKRVRMALSMAINVDDILKYVVFEQGQRISGPGYPVLPWYNPEYRIEHTWRSGPKKGQTEQLQFLPFDMEEAKALLLEAGYREQGGKLFKDGKPLRLQFVNTTGQGSRQKSAVLAKERWEQLGVEVDYKQYEWNDYIQRFIMAMNFDVCVLGWSGGLDFDKRQLWGTDFTPPNGLNFVGYSNPEVDKLMSDILKVYDYDEQVRLSHEIFNKIASDFPYVFLFSPFTTTIADRHLVWRKEVGKDAQGNPIYEDRPLDHEFINTSRATWRFFEPELVRRAEIPQFTDEQKRN